ncbi:WD40/YVTN repeat-like-containing domain superfamily [Sesbania bispinosa]|nr:WD40/YVTN repeat-like-containing domain superfamily [Sesbania bispinosa]
MASDSHSPPLEILVRGPEEFSLWTGPPFANGQPGVKLEKVNCMNAKFSDDGSRLMVMKSNSVISVYDCKSAKEIRSFEVPNVVAAILSPRGTYLQTFKKPAPQEKNVTLWKTETGDPVYQHSQKNLTKTNWPAIQFSSDEATACRMATNEVQFFDTGDFSKGVIHRLKVPGVAAIELSSTPGSHVAAFVPESKGKMDLFMMLTVMPAKATVFDKKCNPLLELGTGPYNTLRWNPKGKFLCLAGFGNLPGDMAFWDYAEKKQLGTTKAEWSVTSEWSPDGCYFMTATTAPRLQVDNGIKIFHYNGSLYFKKMFDKLYQADWKPELPSQGPKPTQASIKASSASSANPPAQKPAAYRPPHAKNAAVIQAEGALVGVMERVAKLYHCLGALNLLDKDGDCGCFQSTEEEEKLKCNSRDLSEINFGNQLFGESPSEPMSKNALRNKKKREKQKEKKAAADGSSS